MTSFVGLDVSLAEPVCACWAATIGSDSKARWRPGPTIWPAVRGRQPPLN